MAGHGTTPGRTLRSVAAWLACALLVACSPAPAPAPPPAVTAPAPPAAAREPVQAVRLLLDDLRRNDLAGFAAHAAPPGQRAELEAAWRAGRSRWPLAALPFAGRLPEFLAAFSRPDAQARLTRSFDRELAGADGQLREAARTMTAFGLQYVAQEGEYAPDERRHDAALIDALGRWAQAAPLADRDKGHRTIARLAAGVRASGLSGAEDLQRIGMRESLRRLGPVVAAGKAVFADYGLDPDAVLAGAEVRELQRDGAGARLELRYRIGERDVVAIVPVQQVDGHWYVASQLREAQAALRTAQRLAGPAPAR